MDWAATAISELWRHAWAVVPVACGAVVLTRVMPLRPVTRHGLWVVVLLWFVAPLLIPKPPEDSIARVSALAERAADELARAAQPKEPTHLVSVQPVTIPIPPARRGTPAAAAPVPDRFPHVEVPAASASPTVRPQRRRPPPLPLASRSGGPGYAKPLVLDSALETCPLPTPDGRREGLTLVRSPARETEPRPVRTAAPLPTRAPAPGMPGEVPLARTAAADVPADPVEEPVTASVEELPPSVPALAMWLAAFQTVRATLAQLPAMPSRIWIGGALLIGFWHLVGLIWFIVRMRRSQPAPRWVVREVRRVAQRCGLQRVPEVRMIDACISPLVLTGLRPRLYLPVHLWRQLDRIGRRAILCHELAHLRRGDDWIRWGELVISTICWWHPLVWWVRGRIHEEADLSCDSWVTWLMPGERRAYAEALLRTKAYVSSGGGTMPAVGLGATSVGARKFARRLTMVMTKTNRPSSSWSGAVLLTGLMAVGWAALPAFSCPPEGTRATPKVRVAPTPPAAPLPGLRVTPAPRPPLASTPSRSGLFVRPPAAPTAPSAPRFSGGTPHPALLLATAGGDDETAERVRAMERQLRDMQAELRQLARGMNRQQARPAPSASPAPFRIQPDSDKIVIRKYELSRGRLEALTDLMIRDDVPVLVRPLDDGIEVHAIERHHRIFRAFVSMIEGREDDAQTSWAPGAGGAAGFERALAQAELAERLSLAEAARARSHDQRARNDNHRALEEQMNVLQDEAAGIYEQAAALMSRSQELHDQSEEKSNSAGTRNKLHKEAHAIERKAEQLERKAEQLERKAEQLERQAEELERQAERRARDDDEAAWLHDGQHGDGEPLVAIALSTAADRIRAEATPEVREALAIALENVEEAAGPLVADVLEPVLAPDQGVVTAALERVAATLDRTAEIDQDDLLDLVIESLDHAAQRD